jgi:lysine/ornithine N-monooxygenase
VFSVISRGVIEALYMKSTKGRGDKTVCWHLPVFSVISRGVIEVLYTEIYKRQRRQNSLLASADVQCNMQRSHRSTVHSNLQKAEENHTKAEETYVYTSQSASIG